MPLRMDAALIAIACLGCASSSDDDAVTPAEIAGEYTFSGQILENQCLPSDGWDLWDDLFAFAVETASGQPSFQMVIEQDGIDLVASVSRGTEVTSCALEGSVGTTANFTLDGPCDDDLIHRRVRILGTATVFGDGWDVAGTLSIAVDGGEAGTPDDLIDCEVEEVSLQGTGVPID